MTFPGRNPSRSRCVAALGALAALGLLTPGTRADWFEDPAVFTPDSWSRGPLPTPVAPVDGTRAWGYDVGPYDHGLTFPRSPGVVGGTAAAITTIAGAYAWAPASLTPDRQFARLDFRAPLAGRFDILPVSDAYPLGLRCLTVEFLGTGRGELSAFDWSGRPVGLSDTPAGKGPHGGDLLAVNARYAWSFTVRDVGLAPGPGPAPAWGVAQVEFTPVFVGLPEPDALALCGFGAVCLAGHAWQRRRRTPSG